MLIVYLNGELAGRLSLDQQRRFVFQYDTAWLDAPHAIPLSLSLPLRHEPFIGDAARPFFANLLPEAALREAIARKLGISAQNDYALLEAIGGECAGAVTLLPEDKPMTSAGGYQLLSEDELQTLIQQLPKRPMLAGEKEMRLSLAGVQNKLPVYFDGKHVSLPQGAAASSHILKPAMRDYQESVINEAFCMRLASRLNLPVPEVVLLNNKGGRVYLVSRYDREQTVDGKIRRLHQEDFCQALGILPEMKYEKEGGPGLKVCFELIRERSVQPVVDLRHLLDWVVFNYLIGNADAHGKNISLLLLPQGPRLAPFYDLMSTAIYPELSDRPAMKIGGEDRLQWIIARHWQQLAVDASVGFKLIKQTLIDMSISVVSEAQTLAEEFNAVYGECPVIEQILAIIKQRVEKLNKSFKAAGL